MEASFEHPAEEIKRLQRCINDLVSILTLPAMWTGGEPFQVVSTLLDALQGMLRLDLIYVRLNDAVGGRPVEMVRDSQSPNNTAQPQEVGELLRRLLGNDSGKWPSLKRTQLGDSEVSIVPLRMGLQGEIGVIVAASQRSDFPSQTERLILSVAANQAEMGLQEARLLSEQKRVASELDDRVAQRTKELGDANQELKLQVELLQHIPVAAWTLEPDGTPDFVNQSWLEFTGQTLEYLRSDPEAWMTAIHPEDREWAATSFWKGVQTGQSFVMEARFLRVQDGVYRWHLNRAVALHDAKGNTVRFVGTSTDIEDVKQSQEKLRRAEERTRLIIDTALDAVITMDIQGRITSWNKQAEVVFGWNSSEVIGQRMSEMVIPERLRIAHERGLNHFLATGEGPILGQRIEVTAIRRDGAEFPAELEVAPMKFGEDWIFSAFLRDITESKRAAENLLQSELNLRQLTETIPEMLWSATPEGEIDYCSGRLLDYSGFKPEEIMGGNWVKLIHPDDAELATGVWMACIESGTPYRVEIRAFHASDRTYRWCEAKALPLQDQHGRILKWHGTVVDMHDRKRAEEELRRSEAFLAEGQRLNLTGSFAWRLDTDKITFSDQLYRIFEFERDMAVTLQQIGNRVHPEDLPLLFEKIEQVRTGGTGDLNYELRLRMQDDSVKYLRTVAHMTHDHQGHGEIIGAVQDVTERRLGEEALSKVRSELAHIARVTSLGALTASIAHEVNQPLSGIVTNASTCMRMLASDPPNIDGALETARRTIRDGKRAAEVIARLRALFGKKVDTTESVDLNEAAREVIALSLSELQRERVIVRQQLADNLPLVTGDRVQLQQVILNLLLNASDAMNCVEDRPRQLIISTEVDEDDCVRLTVQDVGVGIDPHNIERLFEAFYTTKSAGMGIGLSISRTIIESHRGRLWATPNDGPGAAFSISIPHISEGRTDIHNPGDLRSPAVIGTAQDVRNS